jgi:hypothetical protein
MNGGTEPGLSSGARRAYGIAIIVAPVLMLLSTIAFITEGEGINEGVVGGTIGVWTAVAFVIAFIGIGRMLEPRSPRWGLAVTLLASVGFTTGVAFNVDAVFVGLIGPELDTAIDEAIDAGGTNLVGIFAFIPGGWFAPVSMVVAGIALWRSQIVPRWTGALLIVGGVLFVISRPERIDALAIVSDVVIIAALIPVGLAMLGVGSESAGTRRAVPDAG